eukprot:5652377-Pyramimonas_sp.AAC.1
MYSLFTDDHMFRVEKHKHPTHHAASGNTNVFQAIFRRHRTQREYSEINRYDICTYGPVGVPLGNQLTEGYVFPPIFYAQCMLLVLGETTGKVHTCWGRDPTSKTRRKIALCMSSFAFADVRGAGNHFTSDLPMFERIGVYVARFALKSFHLSSALGLWSLDRHASWVHQEATTGEDGQL